MISTFFVITKAAFIKTCAALAAILLIVAVIVSGKYDELPESGQNVGEE